MCVAFSRFLISTNIRCAAFGGVCQVRLANTERPAIHARCAQPVPFSPSLLCKWVKRVVVVVVCFFLETLL